MKVYEYQRNYELEGKHWYFVGMLRVFMSLVDKYRPKNTPDLKIADIGCGTGIITSNLANRGKVIGIDNSPEAIKFCHSRGLADLRCENATALSLNDNSIDLVTAFGVIEHIKADDKFLQEMKRICRPGGRIILFTSAFQFLWNEHDEANEHVRRYTVDQIREKIEKLGGLKILKISYFNLALFFPLIGVAALECFIKKPKDRQPQRKLPTLPDFLNAALANWLRVEGSLFRTFNLPFGVNLIAVLEKEKQ